MLFGLGMGVFPACGALVVGQRMDRRLNLPIREGPGLSLAELKASVSKPGTDLPAFFLSILPVALPVALIAIDSSLSTLGVQDRLGAAYNWIAVLGNKFIAMFLGAVIALCLLAKQKQMTLATLGETMGPPLSTAGVIILITAAGGAFGTMIKPTGIGDSIKAAAYGTGVSLIVLAWLVAAVMKIAQGSGTVSMITTAGMMAGVVGDPASLGYDPLYLYLVIGFGSLMGSWMNDSGFWVVCKLSGFTPQETLKTWTITLATISLIGFFQVFLIASIAPYPFGTPQ
jgi:GntP family gluconate:H+ symporter